MQSTTENECPSSPGRFSHYSASPTVVNSDSNPNSPQPAHCAPRPSIESNGNSSASTLASDDSSDVQSQSSLPEKPIQGWPQLAYLMGGNPDLSAFPRFRDLNVKSLLYYQCQLTILRSKLHKMEYDDCAQGNDWAEFADDLVESNSPQLQLVKEMRVVLKEYNEALLQYSQISALPDPEPFNMRTLIKWLRSRNHGDFKVNGRDGLENTWGDVHEDPEKGVGGLWQQFGQLVWGLIWMRPREKCDLDLAATAPHTEVDGLTRWVAAELIPFRRNLRKSRKKNKQKPNDIEMTASNTTSRNQNAKKDVKKEETLVSWSESGSLRFTSGLSTVIACLLPVVAISVLSQLHGIRELLLCLAGFSVVFALGMIFCTQGTSKRAEIFAATAAFSAVMVVFISIPPAPVIMVPPGSPTPSVTALPAR